MRNDVRIGIAVGVFVIVIGLVWFVFFPKPESEEGAGEPETPVPDFVTEPDEVARTAVDDRPPAPTPPGPVEPPPEPVGLIEPVAPRPADRPDDGREPPTALTPLASLDEPPAEVGRGRDPLPRHVPDAGPALTPSTARTPVRRPLPAARTDEPTDLARPPVGRVGEAVLPGRDETAVTPPAGRRRVYVVTEQDTGGFWDISEKEYGSGTHWELIRDANPDADSNALRPGQELIIPPLPARTPRETTRDELPTGAPAGSDTYTVKDGDSYWKISASLYGRGEYFYLLEEANGIEAGSLREGMVLVVPPKPDAPRAASTGGTTETSGGEEIVAGPGEEIYTVVAGDSYWKIASKKYGQGYLWPAIRDANPGVDARAIQPGKKLVIPSVETARRAVGEAPSGRTETDSGGGAEPQPGRPVFD